MTDLEPALAPTDVVDSDHPAVVDAARTVVGDAATDAERARRLFEWVRDRIEYDMAPDLVDRRSWRASDTLERGWGFCQQKAVLFVAMCRAVGVPAMLAYQSVVDHRMPDRYERYLPGKRMNPHGLAAVRVGGSWRLVDPSLHVGLCERRGLRLVEWNDDGDSVLPADDLAGRPHCDIERELGREVDLPTWVVEATMDLAFLHTDDFKANARRHA